MTRYVFTTLALTLAALPRCLLLLDDDPRDPLLVLDHQFEDAVLDLLVVELGVLAEIAATVRAQANSDTKARRAVDVGTPGVAVCQ